MSQSTEAKLTRIFSVLIPLQTFFAFFTGAAWIIGATFLAINGDWRLIGQGLLVTIFGSWILMIPMLGAMVFSLPAVFFLAAEKKKLSTIFNILPTLYIGGIFGIWCVYIFVSALARTDAIWAATLFAYGVALAPIIYMNEKGAGGDRSFKVIFNTAQNSLMVEISFVLSISLSIFEIVDMKGMVIAYAITCSVLGLVSGFFLNWIDSLDE